MVHFRSRLSFFLLIPFPSFLRSKIAHIDDLQMAGRRKISAPFDTWSMAEKMGR
jgi:hypothetical protein